ncbi:VOC family protein [Nocardia cyriacigeorgica]|uniref:Predicted enzyme related to lactoylglutathione lyase n=1 Tax=Nocardia cyriacigeorgica TaxID=135487 RepID=A0A4U8W9D9_9NOCA|nr:VOC family protein [Nocardia cyriacigeorgica]VFB01976.1 Predicted enzyme related to lactoylglutathione lyase [Nocardia cyriacigeorgica]
MLRGMATVNFYADDLEAAKDWYTEVFGIPPYFHVPGGYYEFRIGDYQQEFGLIAGAYAPGDRKTPGGAILHWHVDDLQAEFDRLLELGATVFDPITEHGNGTGFITASVVDPFGNVLGIMSNPHYLEVLAETGPATVPA